MRRGYENASNIVKEVINEVLLPDADHPVADVAPISKAYVDGLNLMFCGLPFFTVASTLAYAFYGLGHRPYPKMTCLDWIRFYAMRIFIALVEALPHALARNPLNRAARRAFFTNSPPRQNECCYEALPDDASSFGGCPASGMIRRHCSFRTSGTKHTQY